MLEKQLLCAVHGCDGFVLAEDTALHFLAVCWCGLDLTRQLHLQYMPRKMDGGLWRTDFMALNAEDSHINSLLTIHAIPLIF